MGNMKLILTVKQLNCSKKYNWTIDYRVNTIKEKLPSDLKHEAGEHPIKIYWAYNNELSKSIGFDFSKYLGDTVVAEIYTLREPLPEYMKPMLNARGGIVLKKRMERLQGGHIQTLGDMSLLLVLLIGRVQKIQ